MTEVDRPGDELIPARMLNELVYCPRLYFLEYVAKEWEDSADTVEGRRVHRRVDRPSRPLPDPDELPAERLHARSVTVTSEREGIVAKADLIESGGGAVAPVDYKRGEAPDAARVPGGVWPADRVQIAAQMLALRDSGYACDQGVVYYAASKTRVTVPWDDDRAAEVRAAVTEARRLARAHVMPPPLMASPKCPRCSLVGICLPDETNLLTAPDAPGGGAPAGKALGAPRQLVSLPSRRIRAGAWTSRWSAAPRITPYTRPWTLQRGAKASAPMICPTLYRMGARAGETKC